MVECWQGWWTLLNDDDVVDDVINDVGGSNYDKYNNRFWHGRWALVNKYDVNEVYINR